MHKCRAHGQTIIVQEGLGAGGDGGKVKRIKGGMDIYNTLNNKVFKTSIFNYTLLKPF